MPRIECFRCRLDQVVIDADELARQLVPRLWSGRRGPAVTMRMHEAASRTSPSRRRIVGFNPSISGVAASGTVFVFAVSWVDRVSPFNDAGQRGPVRTRTGMG
jgi:hypothetical protein